MMIMTPVMTTMDAVTTRAIMNPVISSVYTHNWIFSSALFYHVNQQADNGAEGFSVKRIHRLVQTTNK